MKKSDKSKHAICLLSIKRHTIKPYNHKWTRFYELNTDFAIAYPGFPIYFLSQELVICSTILDQKNYSVLTTQRMITMLNGVNEIAVFPDWKRGVFGSFKREAYKDFTFGTLEMKDKSVIKYLIETGKASMIMICGVNALNGFAVSETTLSSSNTNWDNDI